MTRAPAPADPTVVLELAVLVDQLGADERRVLLALARRLLAGQQAYGRLDIANDPRDWRRERAEELADALVYGAIAEVAATNRLNGQIVARSNSERVDS